MFRIPDLEFSDYLEKHFPEETIELGKHGAKSVTIQVTDSCNLRCTYCYQTNKQQHFIKLEDAKRFMEYVLFSNSEYCNSSQTAGMILEFIGGEPLLAIDIISDICDYTIRRMVEENHPWLYRTKISICSNGTLYFDEKVQKFIRRYTDMMSFAISIDGNKTLHDKCRIFPDGSGSYDLAIAARNHYKQTYHREANTKMTLAPANIQYTHEAVMSLIDNDYQDIMLNCVFEEGWTTEHAKVYYNELKKIADDCLKDEYIIHNVSISRFSEDKYGPQNPNDNQNACGGLGKMISVNYTGNIFPCIRYMESSLNNAAPEVIVGDLNTGIMGNDKYSEIVELMSSFGRRNQSNDECFYCPIASGCGWCSAYAYQYYGGFGKRTTFTCIMHKAEALANAYYWNKFYLQENINKVFLMHIPKEWALEIISEDEFDMIKDLEKQCFDRLDESSEHTNK